MIDDDFDEMLRRMLEQLFGGSINLSPGGRGEFGFSTKGFRRNELEFNADQRVAGPSVEKIDLGDRFLVIIEGYVESDSPEVKVRGREIALGTDDIRIELPYAIDLEKSSISSRNGIIEMVLIKSDDHESSSDLNEGILKTE
ncbi:MAG: hypothetical protein ACW97A_14010 [Candidatus Thorarchaeota archaeon]|jgi:HSP20 family molecular chaperone IbpA